MIYMFLSINPSLGGGGGGGGFKGQILKLCRFKYIFY